MLDIDETTSTVLETNSCLLFGDGLAKWLVSGCPTMAQGLSNISGSKKKR